MHIRKGQRAPDLEWQVFHELPQMPASVKECHLGSSFEIWTIIVFSNTESALCWALHKPLEDTVLFSLSTMIQCVPVGSEKDSLLQLSGDLMRKQGL